MNNFTAFIDNYNKKNSENENISNNYFKPKYDIIDKNTENIIIKTSKRVKFVEETEQNDNNK